MYHELAEKFRLVEYRPPRFLLPLWNIWNEIRTLKFAEEVISYQEIDAYFRVMQVTLGPNYIRTMMKMEHQYQSAVREVQEIMRKKQPTSSK